MGKNIKTTFSNLWENSYDILVTLDVNELSDKFNEECYLRRQFNSTCINTRRINSRPLICRNIIYRFIM